MSAVIEEIHMGVSQLYPPVKVVGGCVLFSVNT